MDRTRNFFHIFHGNIAVAGLPAGNRRLRHPDSFGKLFLGKPNLLSKIGDFNCVGVLLVIKIISLFIDRATLSLGFNHFLGWCHIFSSVDCRFFAYTAAPYIPAAGPNSASFK